MTRDETRNSVLGSNRNAFRGLILALVVVAAVALLSVITWGAALAVPLVLLVGAALAGTLWVMGMKGRRR